MKMYYVGALIRPRAEYERKAQRRERGEQNKES